MTDDDDSPKAVNRREFIRLLAERMDRPISDVGPVVTQAFEAMTDLLASGQSVMISGFGRFYTRERKEHQTFNPVTRQKMFVAKMSTAVLKPSKVLREKINGQRG